MKRAGEAALRYLRTRWPMAHRIVIVCGGGNNGGDGYVLARFAQAAGLDGHGAGRQLTRSSCAGDARQAYADFLRQRRQRARPFDAALLREGEVIVDALLGTGLARPGARRRCSRPSAPSTPSGKPVFALDVPSGLDATPAWRWARRCAPRPP